MSDPQSEDSWLLWLLRRVKRRPGMYLGDERLNSLSCYVQGTLFGLERAGVEHSPEEAFLKSFGEWLGRETHSRNGDCWFYLSIMPGATGTLSDFFEALDRFLRERGWPGGLEDQGFNLSEWMATGLRDRG